MTNRRAIITAALAAIASPAAARRALAQAAVSRVTAYAFSFPALAGGDIRLADYAGRPLMIVNTASLCGFHAAIRGIAAIVGRVP
jgi:glutathione peroxidase